MKLPVVGGLNLAGIVGGDVENNFAAKSIRVQKIVQQEHPSPIWSGLHCVYPK